MKKVCSILVFLLTLTTFAQNGDHNGKRPDWKDFDPQEMAQKRSQKLAKDLSLDQSQTEKVEAMLLEEIKMRMENGRDKKDMSQMSQEEKAEMRKARMAMHEAQDSKMKEILTAEQYSTYAAMDKRGREDGKKKGKKPAGK